jgi:hypothetical protein
MILLLAVVRINPLLLLLKLDSYFISTPVPYAPLPNSCLSSCVVHRHRSVCRSVVDSFVQKGYGPCDV